MLSSKMDAAEGTLLDTIAFFLGVGAVVVFFVHVLKVHPSPYGRYVSNTSKVFGPGINAKLAWFIQELPAFAVAAYCVVKADMDVLSNPANAALTLLFLVHYFHRVFLFPLRMKGGKPTPVVVCALAFIFCAVNGYLQGRWLTQRLVVGPFGNARVAVGVALFLLGMVINIDSDVRLANLRPPGATGYFIPRGGAFEFVSAANLFGEILEWAGFAVAAWSLAATAFSVFTLCFIGSRAVQHHQWYLKEFKDKYPKTRKALVPFVW